MFFHGLADRSQAPSVSTDEQLRHLSYDLAGSPGSNALAPLLEMTERSRILYGSNMYTLPSRWRRRISTN